jgi:hypothetical protein
VVSASWSPVTTGYQPAIASGCQSATTSSRSTPRGGRSVATSDWKKVERSKAGSPKNSVCRPIQLLFVVLAVFFGHSALAQQFYKWKDEKGQWHYSDFLPSGVTAETMETVDIPQSVSQPFVSSTSGQKKAEDSSDHTTQAASDVDPLGSATSYLLVFPPFDAGKPLSEWGGIPVQSFDSATECTRALQIGVSIVESTDFPGETRASVNFGTLNSRCISLAEFKPLKRPCDCSRHKGRVRPRRI